MPIIPRFQQDFDPNQPPRIDFGDRLVQGMVAGAQAQRFAAEADYRRQMAAIQREELGMAREQRAMAQQERADLAAIEGFMLNPGVAAPPSLTPQAGQAMQRGMVQGLQQGAASGPIGAAMASSRVGAAMAGSASVNQFVQDPALEGARAFADQLKTDSAKTFFYQRFASARKNEMVKAEIGNTQREYGRLVSGLIRNPKIQGKFDGQIEGLKSVIDMLDDEGQTPESRAQILLSVQKEIGAIRKQANDETTRLNKYASTMSMYEAQLGKLDPNKAEYSALLSQFSAFENNPDATPEEIEENNVAIRNISAGRYAWSDKVRDWDTPDRIASREAELYLNNQKIALADIRKTEAEGQIELLNLNLRAGSLDIESKLQEIASRIFESQFSIDDAGVRTIAVDPQSFRTLEAIASDLRGKLEKTPQVSASRGTMESARAEGGDIAASIAGDIVGGVEQKPPTPPPATPQKEAMPVDTADIEEMKSMRQRLADTGLGSKEKLAAYDKRISDAESANQRYADLSKKYQGQPLELEVRRRAALNEGRTDEAEEISYLIGIKSQGWWANLTPGTIGWDELSSLSDEELANEYANFKQRVEAFERRRAERQAYVNVKR